MLPRPSIAAAAVALLAAAPAAQAFYLPGPSLAVRLPPPRRVLIASSLLLRVSPYQEPSVLARARWTDRRCPS